MLIEEFARASAMPLLIAVSSSATACGSGLKSAVDGAGAGSAARGGAAVAGPGNRPAK